MSGMTENAANAASLYGGTLDERLDALRRLCAQAPPVERRGTNLHIHTNESFSAFRSPTEAVWQAVGEGVAVLGINDHYTCAGHDEFRRACHVAHLPATFSMEAVAMDRDAEARGELTNDPGNPGRTYLCAKGVTHLPPDDAAASRHLARMRAALERRNRAMTSKVGAVFRDRLGAEGPTWDDVVGLTPRGNATERHIAKAVLLRLRRLADERRTPTAGLVAACCRAEPDAEDAAPLQNFLRSKLLKAGGPCYVEEAPDAFLSMEDMRDLFLAFGAVPTYPVLANPVTDRERDVGALMDRLQAMRIFALEVIPHRNTRERLAQVVCAARHRDWPVFSGTEHNTPERRPMLAPLSLDPEFRPWFDRSAAVLLGHHALVAQGEPGFVNGDGTPPIPDARERFEHFRSAGEAVWNEIEQKAKESR
jgi:hypothetical protein